MDLNAVDRVAGWPSPRAVHSGSKAGDGDSRRERDREFQRQSKASTEDGQSQADNRTGAAIIPSDPTDSEAPRDAEPDADEHLLNVLA